MTFAGLKLTLENRKNIDNFHTYNLLIDVSPIDLLVVPMLCFDFQCQGHINYRYYSYLQILWIIQTIISNANKQKKLGMQQICQ